MSTILLRREIQSRSGLHSFQLWRCAQVGPSEQNAVESRFGIRHEEHPDLLEGVCNNRVGFFPYLRIS